MKQQLKNLIEITRACRAIKTNLNKWALDRYPNLIKGSDAIREKIKEIDNELQFLLKTCLKTRETIRLESDFSPRGYMTLSRGRGLSHPHSRSSFGLEGICAVDKNGNLKFKTFYGETWFIELGRLRTAEYAKLVDQKRLADFYRFLEEAIPLFEKSDKLYCGNERFKVGKSTLSIERAGIVIYSERNAFELPLNLYRFLDSIEDDNKALQAFYRDFEAFDCVLLEKEKEMKEFFDKLNYLINKLMEYNKPQKLLYKLLMGN